MVEGVKRSGIAAGAEHLQLCVTPPSRSLLYSFGLNLYIYPVAQPDHANTVDRAHNADLSARLSDPLNSPVSQRHRSDAGIWL